MLLNHNRDGLLTYNVFRLPNGEDVVYNTLNNSEIDFLRYKFKSSEGLDGINEILDKYYPKGILKTRILFGFPRINSVPLKYISVSYLLKNYDIISCYQSSSEYVKTFFQNSIKTKFAMKEYEIVPILLKNYIDSKVIRPNFAHSYYVSLDMLAKYASIYYYVKNLK